MSSFSVGPTERGAGFSLIEALIASAVLLVITVGLLPMFMRALGNNVQGQQMTGLVHRAVTDIEEVAQLGWEDEFFVIQSGDTFDGQPGRETEQLFSWTEKKWIEKSAFPVGDTARYRRVFRVRHYLTSTFESSLSPGAGLVHETSAWEPQGVDEIDFDLHEVQLVVTAHDQNTVFGPPRQLTLRFFKAF